MASRLRVWRTHRGRCTRRAHVLPSPGTRSAAGGTAQCVSHLARRSLSVDAHGERVVDPIIRRLPLRRSWRPASEGRRSPGRVAAVAGTVTIAGCTRGSRDELGAFRHGSQYSAWAGPPKPNRAAGVAAAGQRAGRRPASSRPMPVCVKRRRRRRPAVLPARPDRTGARPAAAIPGRLPPAGARAMRVRSPPASIRTTNAGPR